MSISRIFSATIVSSLLMLSCPLMAQTSSELAKQAQNPIANMISMAHAEQGVIPQIDSYGRPLFEGIEMTS